MVTTRSCPRLSLPSNGAVFEPAGPDFHLCSGDLSQQPHTRYEEGRVENVELTMIPESAAVSSPLGDGNQKHCHRNSPPIFEELKLTTNQI